MIFSFLSFRLNKVVENNIGAPKMQNNYSAIKFVKFSIKRQQYWTLLYCFL